MDINLTLRDSLFYNGLNYCKINFYHIELIYIQLGFKIQKFKTENEQYRNQSLLILIVSTYLAKLQSYFLTSLIINFY